MTTALSNASLLSWSACSQGVICSSDQSAAAHSPPRASPVSRRPAKVDAEQGGERRHQAERPQGSRPGAEQGLGGGEDQEDGRRFVIEDLGVEQLAGEHLVGDDHVDGGVVLDRLVVSE